MKVWIVTEHFGSAAGIFRSVHASNALAYREIDARKPGDYEVTVYIVEEETPEPTT